MKAVVSLLLLLVADMQDTALQDRVMNAVRVAMSPALQQFPTSEPDGALPVGGNTVALWMVRPLQPGDTTIEVVANPLNELNQAKAARAMALIERNIEAAQRRAAAQYERAVAEAKRTGKSQEVDGVTLSDEGVEGAKIDAESRVLVDVSFNQPEYRVAMSSGTQPNPSLTLQKSIAVSPYVVTLPANTYRDVETNVERFAEAETVIYLGRVSQPVMKKRADSSVFEVTAASTPGETTVSSLVVRLRGNEILMAELVNKANWSVLQELLK